MMCQPPIPGSKTRKVVPYMRRRRALGPDPDVLYSAAFKHPAKMAFARPFLNAAVIEMVDRVHFPTSDQPTIKVRVFRSVCGDYRSGMCLFYSVLSRGSISPS